MDSPAQMCSVLPQAESSVSECLAAHIHSIQFLCDSFKQEVGFVMFIDHMVFFTDGKNFWLTDV